MTTEDKKLSDMYQKAASAEPSAHLDETILKASRDAVEHTSHAKSPFSGSWPIPISMVAVIIVAVIVVPVVLQESKQAPKFNAPLPAKVTTDQFAAPEADSKVSTPGKMKQQLNSPARPQAASEKTTPVMPELSQPADQLLMEEYLETESPDIATPSLYSRQLNSPASNTGAGRLSNKNDAAIIKSEKKSVLMQGLMKKERAKRVRSAEGWLNYISKLITDGKLGRAKLELESFKKTYPDYIINPEITRQLENQ